MKDQEVRFTGSVPANYDRLMVPLIFQPYADELAERASALRPSRILETAAGTGVVTQALHDALPDAEIVATDLNPPMLEVARDKFRPDEDVDFRPADANETAAAWRLAVERKKPCFFALTRQDVGVIDPTKHGVYAGVSKGAYVLEDVADPQLVIIATGSEVWTALDGAKLLSNEGVRVRVVSMPSWRIFEEQTAEYKASVLLNGVPRMSVEAGATQGWWKYVGLDGDVIGLDRFGASAPVATVMKELGFNPENVAAHAKALLKK